jgi:hypothetical protein
LRQFAARWTVLPSSQGQPPDARAERQVTARCDEDLLAAVTDEVIYWLDAARVPAVVADVRACRGSRGHGDGRVRPELIIATSSGPLRYPLWPA